MAGEKMQATQSGELSQRFIEFVMMHAQNAALFLGQIPNPKTGEGEVNLELAKMFIDQLAMIQEKTRGNLSGEEAAVLGNTISNLHMVYVEVSQQAPKSAAPPKTPAPEQKPETSTTTPDQPPIAPSTESESKKKFTKSYGS
jgi:hypothetical protein